MKNSELLCEVFHKSNLHYRRLKSMEGPERVVIAMWMDNKDLATYYWFDESDNLIFIESK